MLKVSARIFPIGYIISVDNPDFDPHDFYIDGVWERIKGRVIVGVDENQTEFDTTGKTGGAKTHTLTTSEIPAHTHGSAGGHVHTGRFKGFLGVSASTEGWYFGRRHVSGDAYDGTEINTNTAGSHQHSSVGGGQPHNNLPPYHTAYVWKLVSYSN